MPLIIIIFFWYLKKIDFIISFSISLTTQKEEVLQRRSKQICKKEVARIFSKWDFRLIWGFLYHFLDFHQFILRFWKKVDFIVSFSISHFIQEEIFWWRRYNQTCGIRVENLRWQVSSLVWNFWYHSLNFFLFILSLLEKLDLIVSFLICFVWKKKSYDKGDSSKFVEGSH